MRIRHANVDAAADRQPDDVCDLTSSANVEMGVPLRCNDTPRVSSLPDRPMLLH